LFVPFAYNIVLGLVLISLNFTIVKFRNLKQGQNMTKMIKMSLVAAVAVAGLTTVNAQDLEQAIKGVDVSGSVGAQYNNTATTNASADETIYKAILGFKVKAADDVSVAVTTVARAKTTTADGGAAANIVHANFTYTGVAGLTVTAGKQALNTPWTQGGNAIDATQTGTGALAVYNAGFATVAAAHIINNNIDASSDSVKVGGANVVFNDSDLNVAAVIAPIANIGTAQVWFVQVGAASGSTMPQGATAISANLAGKVASVSYDIRHSTLENEAAGSLTNELTKVTLKGSVAGVALTGAYAKTGKDGGIVAFDSDGDAGFKGFQLDLNAKTDANAVLVSASMPVAASTTLAATYIDGEIGTTEIKEWYAQATHSFSKNMSAYVRYGSAEVGTTETDKARIEAVYKF